jgi:IS5 family transposase
MPTKKKPAQRSVKRSYRLRNWKEYTASLVARGSLTLWIDQEALAGWISQTKTGPKGASPLYTDSAILCALTLQQVYHLPLRSTEGLLGSLLALLGVELPVPDYTTLSRRRKSLPVSLPRRGQGQGLHLVIDSTGFKVFGEGEWKVRQHGYSKRRTWRKLHLAIDADTHQIVAAVVTTNDMADCEILPDLLENTPDAVASVAADGSYDARACYQAIRKKGARALIPPRKGARIWQHGNTQAERLERDQNLRAIRQGGRKRWKEQSGYHRRSLSETGMFRLKTLFSDRVSARDFDGQATELFVRCRILNRMTTLGMPESYAA